MNTTLISYLIKFALLMYIGFSLFSLRWTSKKISIVILSIMMLFLYLSIGYLTLDAEYIIIFSSQLICFFLMFKGDILQRWLAFSAYCMTAIIADTLVVNLLQAIVNVSEHQNNQAFAFFSYLIVSTCMMILMILLFIRLFKQVLAKKLSDLVTLLVILPILIVLYMGSLSHGNIHEIMLTRTSLFWLLGLYILYYISLYLVYKSVCVQEEKEALITFINKETNAAMRYSLLEKQYDTNLLFLHQLLHKCQQLNDTLEKRQYDELKKELDAFYNETFNEFNTLYTSSIVVSVLLRERYEILKKYHIKVKTEIIYNDFSFMSMMEQEELFSILIDCAIQANMQVNKEQRSMILKTKKKDGLIILSLVYSIADDYQANDLFSTLNTLVSRFNASMFSEVCEKTSTNNVLIVFRR